MSRWFSGKPWKWAASLIVVLGVSLAAYAVSNNSNSENAAGPVIIIDKARAGDRCVEDTAYMRKNHMKLLLHQRDETVHKGIRTQKYSLKNCINCHASTADNSVIGDDKHFCQSCHTYAAVNLDCWECHSSKPKSAQPAVARSQTTTVVPSAAMPATHPSVGGDKK